jgi:hypothetical protein
MDDSSPADLDAVLDEVQALLKSPHSRLERGT